MALAPGSEVFIQYVGHPTCHRRYLLAHADNANWIVATPDGDIHEESMSRHDPDVQDLWARESPGAVPPGKPANQHDWGSGGLPNLNNTRRIAYLRAGMAELSLTHGPAAPGLAGADAELKRLQTLAPAGVGGGMPGPGAAPGVGAAAVPRRWHVVRSPTGTPAFGEVVDPAALNFSSGDLGIATVAGPVVHVELV